MLLKMMGLLGDPTQPMNIFPAIANAFVYQIAKIPLRLHTQLVISNPLVCDNVNELERHACCNQTAVQSNQWR